MKSLSVIESAALLLHGRTTTRALEILDFQELLALKIQ